MARALTFYQLLGVAPQASADDIRQGYRRRAQKYHPDRYRGRGDAQAIMVQVNRAYEVLSDPEQRAAYDRDIAGAAPGSRMRPVVPLGIGGWPWYVLSATLCVALLAIGFVVLRTMAPQRAVYAPPAAATQSPAIVPDEPINALAPRPVQAWQPPPPPTTPLPDDPVSRLVRDGVVQPTRKPTAP